MCSSSLKCEDAVGNAGSARVEQMTIVCGGKDKVVSAQVDPLQGRSAGGSSLIGCASEPRGQPALGPARQWPKATVEDLGTVSDAWCGPSVGGDHEHESRKGVQRVRKEKITPVRVVSKTNSSG